jgi:hypothetical protein
MTGRFSQRVGARPPFSSGLQEASQQLRTGLWNSFHERLFPIGDRDWQEYQSYAKAIWNHLHWRADQVPHFPKDGKKRLAEHWFDAPWEEFFDLFEFVTTILEPSISSQRPAWWASLNGVLAYYGCAYRFFGKQLAPVTNPVEMAEVKGASESAVPAVASHIRDAIRFLPPNAEFSLRNSVKESISAVEAAVNAVLGTRSGTLSKGLDAFQMKFGELHPAFRTGLDKLYAYTSDENGIRHALTDETANVTIEDARFMLVTCSAFANYLIAKANAAPAP